jgi:hypothetical protein
VLLLVLQLPMVSTSSPAHLAEGEKTEETQSEPRIVIAVAPVKRAAATPSYQFSPSRTSLAVPFCEHDHVVQSVRVPLFLKNRALLI